MDLTIETVPKLTNDQLRKELADRDFTVGEITPMLR